MAAVTDSMVNARSPRSSSSSGFDNNNNNNSSQSQSRRKSAPWSHVVRGESETASPSTSTPAVQQILDSSSPSADCQSQSQSPVKVSSSSSHQESDMQMQMESSDNSNNGNGNAVAATAKKLAWNTKPSNNGGGDSEFLPVMGAHSWPALSESARASPKSTAESLKSSLEGSVLVPQGPVIASTPQKQVSNNANPNPSSNPNHHAPARQKSMKRGGNGGGSSGSGVSGGGGGGNGGAGMVNGGFHQPPPLPSPTPVVVETPQNSLGKTGSVFPDSSPRDVHQRSNNHNWEGGPRGGGFMAPVHNGNEHPQPQRNFRRNNGPHPRGNGSYHNNYNGGRQERDHPNYEWNSHRNFNGRNAHMQQQRVVSGNFPRPPPPSATPFISPPPVPSFGGPIAYPMFYVGPNAPPGAIPMVPPQPFGVFVQPPDNQLRTKIARQIDYYFSSENLCKDTFLREQMDDHGWVPISVIAAFKRVMQLSSNIPFILDALRSSSTVVEVQENKVRRRNDWMNWPRLLPNQFVPPASSTQPSAVSSHNMLADRFKNVGLVEGKAANDNNTTRNQGDAHAEHIVSRSLTDELNNQSTSLQ